jgi:hypothetical protein
MIGGASRVPLAELGKKAVATAGGERGSNSNRLREIRALRDMRSILST